MIMLRTATDYGNDNENMQYVDVDGRNNRKLEQEILLQQILLYLPAPTQLN